MPLAIPGDDLDSIKAIRAPAVENGTQQGYGKHDAGKPGHNRNKDDIGANKKPGQILKAIAVTVGSTHARLRQHPGARCNYQ